ncbi:MAG: cytochrome b/b6, partial [Alphaproteobacteria bacterium]|nr:cytochrome b/b6 [Alphaproteobacteria bacterium]MDX5416744.1 cytochrome b/b6 [Alphaproteobacteria bacterium]MDX5494128.1 cytochrome b/b6 [Alphaproteobacteria bacterium]
KDPKKDTVPFTPYATMKDAFGLAIFMILFAYFVFFNPNALGEPDNYIEANPLSTPAHIVPEWYLLPFYAILRAVTFDIGPIDSKLGGVIAMFGAIAILFVLPWLDTSKVRSARFRPLYRQFFWIFVLVCLGLGYCGGAMPDDILIHVGDGGFTVTHLSQVLTAYYFLHFLVVFPVLGLIEKPEPLPESIAASVLPAAEKSAS